MTSSEAVLARLGPGARGIAESEALPVPYLADLTLWEKWHRARGSLPAAWQGCNSVELAKALGTPAWVVARPWHAILPGIEVTLEETPDERRYRYDTPDGMLTARWTLGPDGDWWQTEYPVKGLEDLPAARRLVEARQYVPDATPPSGAGRRGEGNAVVALELPMRPYSDLLHTMLGWGEGLMLFAGEGAAILYEMIEMLESKLRELTPQVAALPGDLLLAPDNLDGQYISPRNFRGTLLESYRFSAQAAGGSGKPLLVHAGGQMRRLLPLLAEAGVDAIQGVAGPPQSDASLAEARQLAGPEVTLWGGIPQDLLLPTHTEAELAEAVRQAAGEATADGRMILGVADRVPVDADIERLRLVPALLQQAS